ncbi:MAG: hypothetical protein EBZ59_08890 [Planctomycetia bacterium]|nr:hypothetical protein [Planctomycetia bacterium]
MTTEQLRAALSARPFQPFILHVADGREIPVRHPEFTMPPPVGRTIVVYQPDRSMSILDLLLVTEIEFRTNDGDVADSNGRQAG